jgi:ribonuclease E
MAKKMLIDATHAEETRVVVVDGNKVEEFDFESENKRQLAGNIYLAKVTRVEPSLQAAFVDYGGNRHGFLAFSEIHPDYYQIPVADREKLLAEEAEYAKAMAEEDERREKSRKPRRSRRKKSEAAANTDDVVTSDVIDIDADSDDNGLVDVPEAEVVETPADVDAAEAAPETIENDAPEAEAEAPAAAEEPAEDEAEAAADAPTEDAQSEDAPSEDGDDEASKAAKETVAEEDAKDEDDSDEHARAEFRPRKPRPRRYKIQEVVKVRQILLVQVVKEERGNKGAALTTYLSLAGRYCVLMPNTARGGGISRKITNAPDRKKLKEIANEIEVPEGAGLIIRTAGAKRTKTEIKRDYEYLLRQWEQVRDLTLKSIAPAAIYEEGDLIKRSIRDLYNREIDEILVEGDAGYKTAKEYMNMLMPTRTDRVKHYRETLPLFARFQVETYLDGMFNPTVQLKSGGYIVIGITEALVAIDVNSGKATKEGSIEETALRTNLEAAEEVARQLKLRDLAGLIVIDFIDMEERRNNSSVEKRMKDRLKNDRARIQVGRISGFGLMEMSRQRLRQGMLEATTQPCAACHGTGLVRSDDNIALLILRELEEEGTRKRSREVLVTAPAAIANYLLNEKREHITILEARYSMAIRIEAGPHMISPDHKMEKFKSSTRRIPKAPAQAAVTIDSVEPFTMDEELETQTPEAETTEDQPKKKRRRRRRRGGKDRNENQGGEAQNAEAKEGAEAGENSEAPADAESDAPAEAAPAPEADAAEEKPKKSRTTRRRSSKKTDEDATADAPAEAAEASPVEGAQADAEAEEKPKKPARKPRARKSAAAKAEETAAEAPAEAETQADAEPKAEEKPKRKPRAKKPKAEAVEIPIETVSAEPEPAPVVETAPDPVSEPTPEPTPEPEAPPAKPKPKRSGWWSRATGKG